MPVMQLRTPRQLGVLRDLRLDERRALVHVHAAGDVLGRGDQVRRASSAGSCGTVIAWRSRDEVDGVVLVLYIRTQFTRAPR